MMNAPLPAIDYRAWTVCRHCDLPYALRHKEPPPGHTCSVASGCFVIMPFRRCPECDATVHAACPDGVESRCPAVASGV